MNIVMMTNTYKPFVGGIENSIEMFTEEYRKKGHNVLVVAPEYEGEKGEDGIIRIPAIRRFNGTDFSVPLPIPGILNKRLKRFRPDIIHSHHPFLLGDTAQRASAFFRIPIVFTYHTVFEEYTHYVPFKSKALIKFIKQLTAGYANTCDRVVAPSQDIKAQLRQDGVKSEIDIIPTGIYPEKFKKGSKATFREKLSLDKKTKLLGFVSRIAAEKNVEFLTDSVISYIKRFPDTHFVVAGKGPKQERIRAMFKESGLENKYHELGLLQGEDLIDAYQSIDLFVYASKTETQGLVIAEAMAARKPVIALSARAVKNMIFNGYNGKLVPEEDPEVFADAIEWFFSLSTAERERLAVNAEETAEKYSMENCSDQMLDLYNNLTSTKYFSPSESDIEFVKKNRQRLKKELDMMSNYINATGAILPKYKKEGKGENA
ncbi:MAG: glycosyltransferase [Chitinivibrionales bacterium]